MPISNMTMMTVILKLLAARRIGKEGRMDGGGGGGESGCCGGRDRWREGRKEEKCHQQSFPPKT